MSEKRYFSVEEANRLIPHVTGILEDLRRSRQRLLSQRPAADMLSQKARGNGGGGEASAYLSEYSQRFARGLAQLAALGVLLKDIDRGLLDFPHSREGREVYLCWQFGETRIGYWHEVNSGFTGRRPL